MGYTKEEYENLINNSSLFGVDKDVDYALYESERRLLLRLITEYYKEYVYKGRKFDEYCCVLIETAAECIKYYRKDKGAFVNLLNHNMKRNFRIQQAKSAADERRRGITVGRANENLIRKIIAFAKSKCLDLYDLSVQEQIAEAIGISVTEVEKLIALNDDAIVVEKTATNEDGDEVEIFDLQPSADTADSEVINKDEIVDLLNRVDAAYRSVQDRPITKRVLAMVLTAKLYPVLADMGNGKLLTTYVFCSEEIVKFIIDNGQVPTLRDIADNCKVSEQSVSRTYKNFIAKIKR